MDDLISRAGAIAEVEEYLQGLDSCISEPDLKLDGYSNGLHVAINELKGLPAVDAVPLVQRWISVKDRLPEAAGWYLVFYNGSKMQVAFFKGKKWPFDNHYHTITHRMPLPELPKMDGDANG